MDTECALRKDAQTGSFVGSVDESSDDDDDACMEWRRNCTLLDDPFPDESIEPTLREPTTQSQSTEYATHRGYVSKRKIRALTFENIEADLAESCGCERNCCDVLNKNLVMRWREKYHTETAGFNQQRQLYDLYRETLFQDGYGKTLHVVEGQLICKKAWYRILMKISESSYTRIKCIKKKGIQHLLRKSPRKSKGSKGKEAVGFMEHFVSLMGDHSPDSERILLPTGMTVVEIYEHYAKLHTGNACLGPKRFYALWEENMSHVSQTRYCRLTKCNVCVMARQLLQTSLSPAARHSVLEDRKEHLIRQQNERKAYYQRRAEAVDFPQEVLSVIVDGMDQSKTNLPHFKGWRPPAMCDQNGLLQSHIVGALVHGKDTFCMMDLNEWAHDSNLTLCCLLKTLTYQTDEDGMLPKKLYIQLDNCSRENKNRYFIGCMAFVVAQGIVEEVLMSFLMVGHTHEDIDARFSKISSALKKVNVMALPEMIKTIETSTKEKMKPMITKEVYNIRDWLQGSLNDIHNQSYPHVYRIYRDIAGHVIVKFKHWSTDEHWLPLPNEPPIEIFHLDDNGTQMLPHGIPSLVEPQYNRKNDIDRIKVNVLRMKQYMSYKEWMWWETFLEDPAKQLPKAAPWYLENLRARNGQPDPPSGMPTNELSAESMSPMNQLMEAERNLLRHVYTGKKRSRQPHNGQPVQLGEKEANQRDNGNDASVIIKPTVGLMVAAADDGDIIVGIVEKIEQSDLSVCMYSGSLQDRWKVLSSAQGQPIRRNIQKSNVLGDIGFSLTRSGYLPGHVKEMVRNYIAE